MKFFTVDSPFGRTVATLADLVLLNLLFLFSCMPIITIGAACGGLYHTVHAMLTGRCGVLYQEYLAGFKKCFRRGTVLFLLSVLVIAVVFADLILATGVVGIMGMLCVGVILATGIINLGVMAHLPMVLNRNPGERVLTLIREAMLPAILNSWRTLLAVVLNALPFVLFLFLPGLFVESWMFWFLIGFGALAYVNNWLLLKNVDPECWAQMRSPKKENP